MTVNYAGIGVFVGTLADGTPFTGSAPINPEGNLPVYCALYGNKGAIIGEMNFESAIRVGELNGGLYWWKPVTAANTQYPAGFSTTVTVAGSSYSSLTKLTGAKGYIEFKGGNLAAPFSQPITLNAAHAVVIGTPNPKAVTFGLNASTGVFSGMFDDANVRRAFYGVILQGQNTGVGYFLAPNGSGSVELDIAP